MLISILALGGAIGVVFSFRDQRRLSQMHELSVASEISSQRRTEQSYSTFLEESQKTLTLVNDTLELAREATDRAAHSMEQKAESRMSRIEERAERALAESLDKGRFEHVVDDARTLSSIQSIANELAAVEGFLILQDLELGPYSRFVKGIAQYESEDVDGALATLRRGTEDRSVRELQLFSIYWVAYMHIARGQYADAIQLFLTGEETLSAKALERVEIDRMKDDAIFFRIADSIDRSDALSRFNAVAHLLEDLEEVADRLATGEHDPRSPTSHEVAETRGDLFTWVAYDPARLLEPLEPDAIIAAANAVHHATGAERPARVEVAKERNCWDLVGDALRAWALRQAEAVYESQEGEADDFQLSFRHAECRFALRPTGTTTAGKDLDAGTLEPINAAITDYRQLERRVNDLLGSHREHRKTVEFAQAGLICAARLLVLERERATLAPSLYDWATEERSAKSEVRSAHDKVQIEMNAMGDKSLTLVSQLQRRALTFQSFKEESAALLEQATASGT